MQLLSVDLARAIWLGPMTDFNPMGVSLYNILFPFLLKTYKFKTYPMPKPNEPLDPSKGLTFHGGEFDAGAENPLLVDFTIYNDGVIADTRASTDKSEAFFADLFRRFSEIFKMPDYDLIIKKRVYVSRLFVTTDKHLRLLNPRLTELSDYLSSTVEDGTISFQVRGISIWPEPAPRINPLQFTLEPAAGVPFSQNRYFSAAPLRTEQHLELLQKLEHILS
jgi:hypothetical protein